MRLYRTSDPFTIRARWRTTDSKTLVLGPTFLQFRTRDDRISAELRWQPVARTFLVMSSCKGAGPVVIRRPASEWAGPPSRRRRP